MYLKMLKYFAVLITMRLNGYLLEWCFFLFNGLNILNINFIQKIVVEIIQRNHINSIIYSKINFILVKYLPNITSLYNKYRLININIANIFEF